jgi:hypothetical protein
MHPPPGAIAVHPRSTQPGREPPFAWGAEPRLAPHGTVVASRSRIAAKGQLPCLRI